MLIKSIMSELVNPWKLPPIVGEIIDNKAVIIFELHNQTSTIGYSITLQKSIETHNVHITHLFNPISDDIIYVDNIEKIGPTRVLLKFDNSDKYKVNWFIDNALQFEHEIIISNNINKLVCVSCDLLEADTKHSLWNKIMDEIIPNNRTAIMHLGDQAYMDPVFNQCKKIIVDSELKSEAKSKLTNEIQVNRLCLNAYGDRYCATWKPHSKLLANVSNYYIWDDHEIANDIKLDDIIDSTVKRISEIAVESYNMYQQSFHVNKTFIINDYCWYKYINEKNPTMMLAIERTSREVTLQEIFDAIIELNKTKTFNRLILCFSSAPIPQPHDGCGKIYEHLKGLNKFWDPKKLVTLYSWLFNWMGEDKEVVIVGGDVHFGVHGYVTKNTLKIPVLIASPITNQPYPDRSLASKGMHGRHIISSTSKDDIIMFTTISSKARRCYGTIDLESVPIKTHIIYSEDKYPKDLIKYLEVMSKF